MLIDLPWMRFYRKSRRMKPEGGKVAAWERKKKKRRIKSESEAVGA